MKLWQIVLYPTLQVLIGFALGQHFGWDWNTYIVLAALCFFGSYTAIEMLLIEAVEVFRAARYEAMINPPRQPVTVAVQNLNQMVTDKVVIDMERMLARVLIEFPNDLTEKTWIKRGRWQQLGGGGPEQFRNILQKWERAGVIAKKNPNATNSPYRIARKAELARIAGGPSPAYIPPTGQK